MKRYLGLTALLALPSIAFAAQDAQGFIIEILDLMNTTIIPLIFAAAILFFMWNALRFFIIKGATEEGQSSARQLLIYGVMGFVVMLSLWGFVRLGLSALGATSTNPPCPDFIPGCYSGSTQPGTLRSFDLLHPEQGIHTVVNPLY